MKGAWNWSPQFRIYFSVRKRFSNKLILHTVIKIEILLSLELLTQHSMIQIVQVLYRERATLGDSTSPASARTVLYCTQCTLELTQTHSRDDAVVKSKQLVELVTVQCAMHMIG